MVLPIHRKSLFYSIFLILLVGLLYSKALISIASISLIILALTTYERDVKTVIGFRHIPMILNQRQWKSQTRVYWGLACYFIWIVCSFFWSSDTGAWAHDVQGKLLYLGIPLIFIFGPQFSSRNIIDLHLFFYILLGISLCFVFTAYFPNAPEINDMIRRGKAIPAPIDHVRFSMLCAYSSISAMSFVFISNYKKYSLIAIAFMMGIICHLLGVRTGIALLYSGVILSVLFLIIQYKKLKLGIGILLMALLLGIVGFNFSPGIKAKLEYIKVDIQNMKNQQLTSTSDNDRIRSYKIGFEAWANNYILGNGAGDYRKAIEQIYNKKHPGHRKLFPHNQWIRTGVAYGLIGTFCLLSIFIFALSDRANRQNLPFVVLLAIYFVSFLVEANLERYYSFVFFLFMFGWLQVFSKSPEPSLRTNLHP